MIRRRSLLAGMSAVTITTLAGCSGILASGGHKIGDTVEYHGVEVTPDKYTTSSTLTYDLEFNNYQVEAPEGGTFLLTHLKAEHVGNNQRVFPARDAMASEQTIENYYEGERLDKGEYDGTASAFIVDGTRLPSYSNNHKSKTGQSPVYDGSVQGWIVSEISEEFEVNKTKIRATWGGSIHGPSVDEKNLKTVKWTYTEDSEVDPTNQ